MITVGTTASQPASTTPGTPCTTGVQVKADDSNTGNIFIGYAGTLTASPSGVNNMRLTAGQSYFIPALKLRNATSTVGDVSNLWAISDAVGQGLWVDII